MNFDYRKLNIALILTYSACMIFSAFVLFKLQDALVYDSQVISIADLGQAQPVFTKLYLVLGFTLLVGLGALVIILNKKGAEVIYVEKKKSSDDDNASNDDQDKQNHTLDIEAIKTLISNESDEFKLAKDLLTHLCKHLKAGIGAFYKVSKEDEKRMLEMRASYALTLGESQIMKFEFGEGLVGQAALEEKTLIIDDIPEGYIKVVSGLGSATPTHLMLVPVKKDNALYGVVEIASFTELGKTDAEMVGSGFRLLTQTPTDSVEKVEIPKKSLKEESKPEVKEAKNEEKKARSSKKGNNKA